MNDGEGTIQQNGDKGRNAGRTAEIALPTGAGVGTIGGASSGHPIEGGLAGLGAGLATAGVSTGGVVTESSVDPRPPNL